MLEHVHCELLLFRRAHFFKKSHLICTWIEIISVE